MGLRGFTWTTTEKTRQINLGKVGKWSYSGFLITRIFLSLSKLRLFKRDLNMQLPNLIDNGTLLSLSFTYSVYTQGNAGLAIWEIAVRESSQNKNSESVNLSSRGFFLLNGLQVIIYFLWKMELHWEVPKEAECATLLDQVESLAVSHSLYGDRWFNGSFKIGFFLPAQALLASLSRTSWGINS